MADDRQRVIPMVIDVPFQIRYEPEIGLTVISTTHGDSAGGQYTVEHHLSPTALIELRRYIDELEAHSDTPPSAHATPRTKQ